MQITSFAYLWILMRSYSFGKKLRKKNILYSEQCKMLNEMDNYGVDIART